MEAVSFYNLTLPELEKHLVGLGKHKFRAQQVFRWIYGRRETDFEKMTNLSKAFRSELPNILDLALPEVLFDRTSQDGTRKFLVDVGDGMNVECVLIPSKDRLTLCVSSEVGCNLACKFCYTGKQKLKKRLSAGQIVGQFLVASDAIGHEQRITNIVFMGMGEPLDNTEEVLKAIEILHSPWGINFSRKKITVSTSGIVPMIPRLTEAGVRLAVSLNGSNDDVRSEVMPINKRWPISELLDACMDHYLATRDRITFEYVLLKGVTDSVNQARELYHLTKRVPCKINIIPFNEHPGSDYLRPSDEAVDRFQKELMRLGAHVLRRRTMGRDIYAACGQLTSAHKNHPQTMTV